MQHYVGKVVSDLRQVDDFLLVFRFPPPIKLTANDIAEILLKVASYIITLISNPYISTSILLDLDPV